MSRKKDVLYDRTTGPTVKRTLPDATKARALDNIARDRLGKTIGAAIQNRAGGCLDPVWCESVGFAIADQIDGFYELKRRE